MLVEGDEQGAPAARPDAIEGGRTLGAEAGRLEDLSRYIY
jgi:hypothetical protein